MLLVASDEGSAAIWAHQGGFNCWQKLVELGDGGDQAASAVCWAPLTGRPVDTVAIGVGNAVSLWDVTTNADGVQVALPMLSAHDAWCIGTSLWTSNTQ